MMTTEKTYKYYLFYLVENEYDELYAYTDEKKIYKRFLKEKNLNIFKVRKCHLTKEQVNYISQKYPTSRLIIKEGYTKEDKNPGIPVPISMVMTEDEEMSLISTFDSLINYELFVKSSADPYVFKQKVIEALDIFGYNYNYLYMNAPEKIDELYPNYQYDYDFDLFGAYLKCFGKYMRKD